MARKPAQEWSTEEIEKASSMWEDGHSGAEIAKALGTGRPRGSIFIKMYRLGVRRGSFHKYYGRDFRSNLCQKLGVIDLHSIPEYSIWIEMRRRCRTKGRHNARSYTEKSISVCPEWEESFDSFYRDMGPRPSPKHTIERTDNDKGYGPENCIWATHTQQSNNRRSTVFVEYQGERMSATNAWRASGSTVKLNTFAARIRRGVSVEEALK